MKDKEERSRKVSGLITRGRLRKLCGEFGGDEKGIPEIFERER